MRLVELGKTRESLIALLFLINCLSVFGGGENRTAGGRSSAMGGASIAVSDVWSGFNNQAGLAKLKSTSAGIYYENRYLLKQLGYSAAVFAHPSRYGTIAATVTNFGYAAWSENKLGLAYAREIGKFLSAGIQLDYIRINKEEPYENFNLITFEAGLIAKLSPHLSIGTHLYNPLNSGISGVTDERAPSILKVGIAYQLNDQFLITAETEKNIYEKLDLKTGVEYHITDPLFIRAGVSTNPSFITFGAGFYYKNFIIDVSTSRHQVLGFSPQLSISYEFR